MRKVMSRPAGPMRRANLGSWAGMWLDGLGGKNPQKAFCDQAEDEDKGVNEMVTP